LDVWYWLALSSVWKVLMQPVPSVIS
jgi:hypothetical protein